MAKEVEEWRSIKGHSDYLVSSKGRILSKGRWLINKTGQARYWRERLLKPYVPKDGGYLYIRLGKNGGCHWVHKLVAKAFLPNLKNKRCVHHKNRNKQDNRVENLKWVSHQENMNYELEHTGLDGLMGNQKVTARQRRVMKNWFYEGIPDKLIARKFGLSEKTVQFMRYRMTNVRYPSGVTSRRNKEKK